MSKFDDLRKTFTVLKSAVEQLGAEIDRLDPGIVTSVTLRELLANCPNGRARSVIMEYASKCGCPERTAQAEKWKIGPLLGAAEMTWLTQRNCGVTTMKEIVKVLDKYR